MATSPFQRLLLVLCCFLWTAAAAPQPASPLAYTTNSSVLPSSSYWFANVKRQGTAPFNPQPKTYQVTRNVKDFGAVGNGLIDDTRAINDAISSGPGRCGLGCNSTTTSPALVYFPPGTYLVSKPIIQYYQTQFVGDAVNPPTIKAAPTFEGFAVIDTDPYEASGANWYINQNNFLRQIRNFVIDMTAIDGGRSGTAIHWQVAQGTSLQNIRFEMVRGGAANKQQGVWMDNGSGGFMTDLTFNGGLFGMWVGNQQFTSRNLTFNGCDTAIYMNWNWLWAFKSLLIKGCRIGIDMANAGVDPAVGSVLVQDSIFDQTPTAIRSSYGDPLTVNVSGTFVTTTTHGTLVLDNVDFTTSDKAVVRSDVVVLPGRQKIISWAQGHEYSASTIASGSTSAPSGAAISGMLNPPRKDPSLLLKGTNTIFERSRPQYQNVPASKFISVKSAGAVGDGVTDDTAAIQRTLDKASPDEVVYFDHGVYLVSQSIRVPASIRITGEIWPTILAAGPAFQHETKPVGVFQVGQPGDVGAVEISDLLFSTRGPQPGAVMIEWNLGQAGPQGSSGMWDVHVRIGGATGTELQSTNCLADAVQLSDDNKDVGKALSPDCTGAAILFHVTATGSVYVENAWFWVADHELDIAPNPMISIFSGRGVLIESKKGPVWMYGTASEHSQLYQYQISGAQNVYLSAIQTETPYYQTGTGLSNANPDARAPFTPNLALNDPTFANCPANITTGTDLSKTCRKSWGLRILNSHNVLVYGTGLYSFFDAYSQACLADDNCQDNILSVAASDASIYGLSTKASTNMVSTGLDSQSESGGGGVLPPQGQVKSADNRDLFCSTLALFREDSGQSPVPRLR